MSDQRYALCMAEMLAAFVPARRSGSDTRDAERGLVANCHEKLMIMLAAGPTDARFNQVSHDKITSYCRRFHVSR